MASPIGNPANQGSGIDQFKAVIMGWVKDAIQQAASGGNGLHVDGATGDLVADRGQFRSLNYVPGASGWGMAPSGNAEFNDLTLRGGIIGNDALTSPVVLGVVSVSSGVTFTTTSYGNVLSTTVTVPSGVTQLLANAQSGAYCQGNSNTTGGSNGAGGDAIYSRTVIGSVTGQGFGQPVLGSGSFGSVNSSASALLTGLTPGGTVTFQSQTFSGYQNIPANAGNKLTLTAILVWLR